LVNYQHKPWLHGILCATVRLSSFHDVALQLEDENNTFLLEQDRLQWTAVITAAKAMCI